jgi:membrane-associated phospholipid phosphatase
MNSNLMRARFFYVLGLIYSLVGYLGTNQIAALNPFSRPALPIATDFDQAIPFVPGAVVFYVMFYPLLATPLLLSRSANALYRISIGQAVMNTIAYVVFLLFPTRIDRPPAAPDESASHFVLDLLFQADHPYNTFPSLHVGQMCILALFFIRYSPDWFLGSPETSLQKNRLSTIVIVFHAVATLLVAASTVLIKQHYLADVVAGAFIAWSMSTLFFQDRNNS